MVIFNYTLPFTLFNKIIGNTFKKLVINHTLRERIHFESA
jgi:hypothetical protein